MSRTTATTPRIALVLAGCMMLVLAGCRAPGKPGPAEPRPDQVMEFAKLYKQNCAACHGEEGKRGLAVSLSNPVYIAIAGKEAILNATAKGGPGKLMPAFAKSYGGTLTDAQIEVLADGIVRHWGQPQLLAGKNPPSYAATLAGDASAGKAAYTAYCTRCHAAEAIDTDAHCRPHYRCELSGADQRSGAAHRNSFRPSRRRHAGLARHCTQAPDRSAGHRHRCVAGLVAQDASFTPKPHRPLKQGEEP